MADGTLLDFAPGDRLRLTHLASGLSADLLVEPAQRGLLLARAARPYHRLHASVQRETAVVTFKQTRGNAAALWLVEAGARGCVRIKRADSSAACPYLDLDSAGHWKLSASACEWRREAEDAEEEQEDDDEAKAATAFAAQFARDGYFLLPSLVPRHKVDRALRFLNHHLGSADLAADLEPEGLGMEYVRATGTSDEPLPEGVVKLGGGHTCTCSLAQAAPLLGLLDAPERRAIARALGGESSGDESRGDGDGARALSSMFGVQVALRFPLAPFAEGVADGDAALPSLLERAGLDWHTDAAKYNEKKRFDVVVGVFLSRVAAAHEGCLYVLPGSHRAERAARERGQLPKGALHSPEAMDEATPRPGAAAAAAAHVPARAARPILVEPGTCIVFDKDLLHSGGPNLSSAIRYALYARMRYA